MSSVTVSRYVTLCNLPNSGLPYLLNLAKIHVMGAIVRIQWKKASEVVNKVPAHNNTLKGICYCCLPVWLPNPVDCSYGMIVFPSHFHCLNLDPFYNLPGLAQ